ncbi:hypothetical protein [uncultured Bacteroides sp.]|nr:hypothetical protein [uncultured Bacteroides sp.]
MIMKMEKEMKYEAPEVNVLEVEVEKGFAGSDTGDGSYTETPEER